MPKLPTLAEAPAGRVVATAATAATAGTAVKAVTVAATTKAAITGTATTGTARETTKGLGRSMLGRSGAPQGAVANWGAAPDGTTGRREGTMRPEERLLAAAAIVALAVAATPAWALPGRGWPASNPKTVYEYKYPVEAVFSVVATGYNKDDGFEWCHMVGGRRVCGDHVYAGGPPRQGYIAISHSLMGRLPWYSRVRIRGNVYRVMDLMSVTIKPVPCSVARNARRDAGTCDRIDIYMDDLARAQNWGFQKVDVELLGEPTWR